MSILKSILHRYNRATQSYDILHPETEHAQVKDFGEGVIAHLISGTLAHTISTVSTGSVFGKLVIKLFENTGAQSFFSENDFDAWYIRLGSIFGNVIIQGRVLNLHQESNTYADVSYPIIFQSNVAAVIPFKINGESSPTSISVKPTIIWAKKASNCEQARFVSDIAFNQAGLFGFIAIGK